MKTKISALTIERTTCYGAGTSPQSSFAILAEEGQITDLTLDDMVEFCDLLKETLLRQAGEKGAKV